MTDYPAPIHWGQIMIICEVTHSRKDGRDPARRIDALRFNGGIYDIDMAIEWVKLRVFNLYTKVGGRVAIVYVRRNARTGREYLTTSPDGYGPNNLLHLPDC